MLKVLLVDDLRDFVDPPEGLVIARTSQAALNILKDYNNNYWDSIWLDHDLGMVDSKEDTIMPVVDYLAEKAFFEDPIKVNTVYVHTANSVGRDQMIKTLNHYGYKTVVPNPRLLIYKDR